MQYITNEWPDNTACFQLEDECSQDALENLIDAVDAGNAEYLMEPDCSENHSNDVSGLPLDYE